MSGAGVVGAPAALAAPHPVPAQPPPDVLPSGRPRLRRRAQGRIVAGVAGGVADHLGLPALGVRLVFLVLSLLTGFGIVTYLGLWVFVPQRRPQDTAGATSAGLAAASRTGLRSTGLRRDDLGQVVALVVLGVGILLLGQGFVGVRPSVFWPAVLVLGGVAVLWLQADAAERRRAVQIAAEQGRRRSWRAWLRFGLRVAAGGVLVVIGLASFLAGGGGDLSVAVEGLFAAAVLLAGVVLITGPWLLRLWRELGAERRERILSQERADVAAHLHDSVLQTLALIQKQSEDPRAVVALARRQERDLRTWLYDGQAAAAEASTFKGALTRTAVEVEDTHGTPVEVVVVGDTALDEGVLAVLAAAREAMTNAAKHAGAEVVDVYAEVEGPPPSSVEVFVRDRGRGFDPQGVPEDRFGVRGSIVGRMERAGGSARVRSAPGEGTEVQLLLRRNP